MEQSPLTRKQKIKYKAVTHTANGLLLVSLSIPTTTYPGLSAFQAGPGGPSYILATLLGTGPRFGKAWSNPKPWSAFNSHVTSLSVKSVAVWHPSPRGSFKDLSGPVAQFGN